MGIIKAAKLTFDYLRYDEDGNVEDTQRAVDSVDLDIQPGEFVAVLGHNGSGKSTFAKHINALLLPTEGTIWIDGIDTSKEPELWKVRQKAGMVFQNPGMSFNPIRKIGAQFLEALKMDAYVQETYAKSVAETPRLAGESALETRRREISYLNQKWFMQTLLDRMGVTSTRYGLSARVPFADYRIVEYLWNVPWEMKAKGGVVKGLLREAGRGLLPDDILFRKKSPYPKTYDKAYETILVHKMRAIMAETHSPIRQFLDTKKVERFLSSPSDYGKPWYGQLMAAPQMIAYLIQVNYWLEKYHIKIEL